MRYRASGDETWKISLGETIQRARVYRKTKEAGVSPGLSLQETRRQSLRAHVSRVHVAAGVNVVDQIPAGMIGIVVHGEVLAAIPAPIRSQVPIPIGDLEIEAAGKPEAVTVAIEPLHSIAVRCANAFKVPVFERTRHDVAPVVRPVVAIPVIVADVRNGIHAVVVTFDFRLGAVVALRRRALRNVALVCARAVAVVVMTFFGTILGPLGKSRHGEK